MTNAISAFGTKLQIGDGATTESFTDIAELLDVTGPELSADTEDVTSHGSTGGWEEAIVTILRSGSVNFSLNFYPTATTQGYTAGLLHDYVNKTLRNFRLVFPDTAATTWAFSAYVTKFTPKAPVKGGLGADVSLKVTGQPTLA